MDFSFTEEQTLLRNTVQSLLSDKYDFDTRRKVAKSADGWRPEIWAQFAELGLLAAPFSEEMGGLGGGAIETMIVMEEFGRHLVIEPYVETVVIAGGFLREGGTPAQQEAHIPGIIGGETVWAFAYAEPQGRYNLADLTTTAKKDGAGYVINGYKAVVLGAPWAQKLIVTARTSGGQRDRDGVSVFIVDKSAAGVSTRDYPTVDGRRASEIPFENVKVDADALIGAEGKGLPLVEKITDQAIAALSAEAIGCMKELNTATVEYCKTRKQFGVPIGKFQVLQHRMVDMQTELEQATSMAILAATFADGEDNDERSRIIAGAKYICARAARKVAEEAIQLHGGIGMTWEYNLAHHAKRLVMIAHQFGDDDHHLKAYAKLMQVA